MAAGLLRWRVCVVGVRAGRAWLVVQRWLTGYARLVPVWYREERLMPPVGEVRLINWASGPLAAIYAPRNDEDPYPWRTTSGLRISNTKFETTFEGEWSVLRRSGWKASELTYRAPRSEGAVLLSPEGDEIAVYFPSSSDFTHQAALKAKPGADWASTLWMRPDSQTAPSWLTLGTVGSWIAMEVDEEATAAALAELGQVEQPAEPVSESVLRTELAAARELIDEVATVYREGTGREVESNAELPGKLAETLRGWDEDRHHYRDQFTATKTKLDEALMRVGELDNLLRVVLRDVTRFTGRAMAAFEAERVPTLVRDALADGEQTRQQLDEARAELDRVRRAGDQASSRFAEQSDRIVELRGAVDAARRVLAAVERGVAAEPVAVEPVAAEPLKPVGPVGPLQYSTVGAAYQRLFEWKRNPLGEWVGHCKDCDEQWESDREAAATPVWDHCREVHFGFTDPHLAESGGVDVRAGVVSWPLVPVPGEAHASVTVCSRNECITEAKTFVQEATGRVGVYVSDVDAARRRDSESE